MKRKLTVSDLKNAKGKRKLVITTAFDTDTAMACEAAGIDIILTWANMSGTVDEMKAMLRAVTRGAPNTMIGVGIPRVPGYTSESEAVRCAFEAMSSGGDLIYASGMEIAKYRVLTRQRIPCVAHVGLIPIHATWTGGLRAVGKTAEEAIAVYRDTLAYQEAGCVAVEMECVPESVARYITEHTELLTFSMGSGRFCDAQFLFTCDLLGSHNGHYPRHAIRYRDHFTDSVEALTQFRNDVTGGSYPNDGHVIKIRDDEFQRFLDKTGGETP